MGAFEIRNAARAAIGVAAVLAQISVAIFYSGWSLLVVPPSVTLVLLLLMLVALIVAIWLAIRHTWLAPIVPIASIITLSLIYELGKANLDWGA